MFDDVFWFVFFFSKIFSVGAINSELTDSVTLARNDVRVNSNASTQLMSIIFCDKPTH